MIIPTGGLIVRERLHADGRNILQHQNDVRACFDQNFLWSSNTAFIAIVWISTQNFSSQFTILETSLSTYKKSKLKFFSPHIWECLLVQPFHKVNLDAQREIFWGYWQPPLSQIWFFPRKEASQAGRQKLATFWWAQKWPQNFRQACICYFRDKFVVFPHNCKFIQYNMQYIPCNTALLAQETLFTQKSTKSLPKKCVNRDKA